MLKMFNWLTMNTIKFAAVYPIIEIPLIFYISHKEEDPKNPGL